MISDILIIADENNTFASFIAELIKQKYLNPDDLKDPETKEWLEDTYATVSESISLNSLLPNRVSKKKINESVNESSPELDKIRKEVELIAKKSPGKGWTKKSIDQEINRRLQQFLNREYVNEAKAFKKGDKVSYKNDDGKTKSGYIIKKMTKTFRGKKNVQYLIGKTKTTDPKLGRFDTVSSVPGKEADKLKLEGAPYEYDNISEPYSIKVGDMVKNTNPSCPHNGSQGVVQKVISMPNDIGDLIKYVVMNRGDNYQQGDMLTKTIDQLKVM